MFIPLYDKLGAFTAGHVDDAAESCCVVLN